MPSVSKKQHNFMAAIAANPKFAKKVGIPKTVGEEFMKADKGRKFNRGGEMAESKKGGKAKGYMFGGMLPGGKKPSTGAPQSPPTGGVQSRLKGLGAVKAAAKRAGTYKAGGAIDGVATKGKTKGKMVTMKRGGKC